MKIVGVINDYKEALEIEDIVKVFVIKQRISNLLSLERNNNYKNDNSNFIVFKTNNANYFSDSDEKNLHIKNNEDNVPVFNVRGLI
ncbi:hypothetical protein AYK20_01540 [Thermoplasmatales archaeon SG8-52-1]|nr:MAG: hypothetical protein AYK20_01540 [Thermoplasmatales archaeon SG8-52-1]